MTQNFLPFFPLFIYEIELFPNLKIFAYKKL